MSLASYRRSDIVAFATAWERNTLDNLAKMNAMGSAIMNALYGKNSPSGNPSECQDDGSGSRSVTADGALLPWLDMALRHNHIPSLQHMAAIATYCLEFIPWFANKFNDQPGPGEYGVTEPCWTRQWMIENDPWTDSDKWRHYGVLGLFMILINPRCRAIGGWTDGDIKAFADHHLKAVLAAGPVSMGEILRASYRSDCLLACSLAYKEIGDTGRADYCYDLVKSFWHVTLNPRIYWTGSKLGPLPTYGPMIYNDIDGEWEDPWNYGWAPYLGQSWYFGHLSQSLIQAGLEAMRRHDAAFLSICTRWARQIASWCDPFKRHLGDSIPLASATDPVKMKNVLVHGDILDGKPDGPYVTEGALARGDVLSVSDYEALGVDDVVLVGNADKYFHADAQQWSTVYKDPDGGTHRRRHWSSGTYVPGQLTLEKNNAGGLLSAIWLEALLTSNVELSRYLEIKLAQGMGSATSTGKRVVLSKFVDGIFDPRQNNVAVPGRAGQWELKRGWEGRSMMVGVVETGEDAAVEATGLPYGETGGMVHSIAQDDVAGDCFNDVCDVFKSS